METKEIWKPVRGFEEWAEISNLGQIHRFRKEWYCGENHKSKRIQEETWTYGHENHRGYLRATIGGVNKGVHQWVYLTFVGDIPEGMQVNHIDENKHNNRLDNLNLMTPKENIRWGTGIARKAEAHRGMKHSEKSRKKMSDAHRGKKRPDVAAALSKAVQALDKITGEVVMEFPSTREAERQGFNSGNISACCNGKRKSYKGLIWRFKDKK